MKNKNLIVTIMISISFFIAIAVSTVSFYNTVDNELEKSVTSTLSDMANQQQLNLNRQLESMIFNLNSIAETLVIIGDDEEAILDYVYDKKDLLHYDTVIICQADGEAFDSVTKKRHDVNNEEYFIQAIQGNSYASSTYTSPYTKNTVAVVSVPIFMDGEVVGVLAVEYNTTYLATLLTTFTDERGLNLVVDANSNIVISTNEFVLSFDAFKNAEFNDGVSFDSVVEDFSNGDSGSISYTLNGIEKYGEYRPIAINGWTLFFEISHESISESANTISRSMILISFFLVIGSLVAIIYIVSSKNKSAKDLEQTAYYDELTKIPNLIKFKLLVSDIINKNPHKDYTMVKMDTVNFKAINDMFGFEEGDKVIRAIANTGKTVPWDSFVQARVSAEEFMLFAESKHFENLEESSKQYEASFKESLLGFEDYQFSFRYGRYFLSKGETDINDVIHKTNIAHSFAKQNTKTNIWDYDENVRLKLLKDTELANKMHKALENEDFKVFLQPKYSILDGTISGAEALVRWIDTNGAVAYPDEFIPLFEQNGFIIELDKYMLRSVCKMLKSWKEQGRECLAISVNFSRLHLQYTNFLQEIKEIVYYYGVDPKYIEIELTESTVLENEEALTVLLKELQSYGFSISIDDFGSGYSSLGMLKNFKVNTLKLDRSFFMKINDEDEDDRGRLVVESITSLANSLGMYTVAEGIEEVHQRDFLEKIKCDAAQGYLFSKPLSIKDFENLYFGDENK